MSEVAILGIDVGKTSCSVAGMSASGQIVLRRRVARNGLPSAVGKTAALCVSGGSVLRTHHVGRGAQALGHQVRLMPPEYVLPYMKACKNDNRDAKAIAEAATHPISRRIRSLRSISGAVAMAEKLGFFDVDERYAALSAASDPLERLLAVVELEIFRPVLDAALKRSDRSRGGRPPYDAVMMFRILVLKALYSLSDEQAEFQLRYRLSFMRFAGLGLRQAVPDAKTTWLYREQLKQAGAIERLFRRFNAVLAAKGFLAMGGQIVDTTLIAAPRQKLTIEEKATIRDGSTPEGWSRAKRAQKDRDARWTLKRGRTKPKPEGAQRQAIQIAVPIFGYKHGSRSFPTLLDPENTASRVCGGHRLPHQAQSESAGAARPV